MARGYLASLDGFARTACSSGYGTSDRLEDAIYGVTFLDCEGGLFSNAGGYSLESDWWVIRGYYREMQNRMHNSRW